MSLSRDWINNDFRNILITYNNLNNYNNLNVPLLGTYTYSIFSRLLNLSYQFQQQFHCLTYNPFDFRENIYFCNNQLYHNDTLIILQNVLEYSKSLIKLFDIIDYLKNNNYVNDDVNQLYDLTYHFYSVISIITRNLTTDTNVLLPQDINEYGYTDCNFNSTSVEITNNALNVYGCC